MTSRAEMLDLLQTRRKHFSLESAFYNDPAIFNLDMKGIFGRTWIFAGPSCEISEPGQYVTVDIGRTSVIVLRDRTNQIRAFHNTCRHRGSKLCESPTGRLSSIVCPYHEWTYDLTGRLKHTGRMHDGFDPAEFGLLPVHVEELCGTIYICLAETPPDFSAYKSAVAPYIARHGLENTKVAHVAHVYEKGNWKLVMENSRECFHCTNAHPELARTFLINYDFNDPANNKAIEPYWAKYRALGLPYESLRGEDFRAVRLPFLPHAQSITMDGKPAVARHLGTIGDFDIGSARWVHYPSTFNHALGDYAFLVRMLPISPEESVMSAWWLVDKDAVEGKDYDLANLIKVWDDTNLQDRDLVERNQRGVNSSGYRPGPYSQTEEIGVINFVDWYCEEMTRFLGGGKQRALRSA